MYVGSALYVWQVVKLRKALRLGPATVFWALFNAAWPLALWSVSLACILDETPHWLLEGLRRVEHVLPSALYSSLFLDPPALYPVCLYARVKPREAGGYVKSRPPCAQLATRTISLRVKFL